MQATESYYQLKNSKIDDYVHPEWGINDFKQLKPNIESLYGMMLRMGYDIEKFQEIPRTLAEKGNEIIDYFYNIISTLKSFNLANSKISAFKDQEDIIKNLQKIFTNYLTSLPSSDPNSQIFLAIYNTIISFEPESEIQDLKKSFSALILEITNAKIDYQNKTNELIDAKKEYDYLYALLTNQAKEKSTEDYAAVFEKVATKNRNSSIWWLIVSICAIIAFCFFIPNESKYISIDTTQNATVTTLEYLKRLLIISFFIYFITFLIKQYNIKKHLETLNTHRQNTLNSYNLFLKSMNNADQDVKNALMVEVARAIYESGQTGYINTKDEGNNSSSIMEITKFIKPNP